MNFLQNSDFAPIALFVYKRPDHTKKVLDALAKCKESRYSKLYVFSDGPTDESSYEEIKNIKIIRDFIKIENRFLNTELFFSEFNKGCSKSIIDGIDFVIAKHGKIIVLEDDIIVSNAFLAYMNFCLNYFKDEQKIASVNAFSYNIPNLPKYYFLKGGDCWGWGTWKRGWDLFNPDASKLFEENKNTGLLDKWETGNLVNTLKSAILYPDKIWDIQWSLSLYLNDKLSIWPGKSYLYNIGYDGTGTNIMLDISKQFLFNPKLNKTFNSDTIINLTLEESKTCRDLLIQFHSSNSKLKKKSLLNRITYRFKKYWLKFN